MRAAIGAALFAAMMGQGMAQQPAPYVPITIDQATYDQVRAYLDTLPFKQALPLVTWLEMAERNAVNVDAAAKRQPPPATPPQSEPLTGNPAPPDTKSFLPGDHK